jgi:hypothetical protein
MALPVPLAAQTIGPVDQVLVGDSGTQSIDTNLDGHPVPADIGQIFLGNTAHSADAITIDSGSNFPPGIAFRRYLGDPSSPTRVTAGTQLGYLDFRAYSGSQFFNAASIDVQVDGMIAFADGELPGTKMRFAVSDGQRVYVPMELRANGRLELGAIVGAEYYGPGALGDPRLFVNTAENEWSTIFAARPAEGPGYALRLHTQGETADDYILGGSSGVGAGTFKFSVRGNGDVHVAGGLFLGTLDVGSAIHGLKSRLDSTSLALGAGASASSINSTAIGNATIATGANALAIGNGARGNGSSAISHGDRSIASAAGAVAFGSESVSTATSSTALGQKANASRDHALAAGAGAVAQGVNASAVGTNAVAIAQNATALGAQARASHENSTAVGTGAATTNANEVSLGGSGSSVRVGDIEASTAAQAGPVQVVTVDQYGTLGRQNTVTTAQLETVRVSMISALAVSDAQFSALGDRVGTLEGHVDELFDLTAFHTKNTRQGIAAVTALAQPHFPSGAGRTSYASNVGYFRGEVGFSAGLMHRFEGDFAVSAGISYAGGKNTAARLGVAGEF